MRGSYGGCKQSDENRMCVPVCARWKMIKPDRMRRQPRLLQRGQWKHGEKSERRCRGDGENMATKKVKKNKCTPYRTLYVLQQAVLQPAIAMTQSSRELLQTLTLICDLELGFSGGLGLH